MNVSPSHESFKTPGPVKIPPVASRHHVFFLYYCLVSFNFSFYATIVSSPSQSYIPVICCFIVYYLHYLYIHIIIFVIAIYIIWMFYVEIRRRDCYPQRISYYWYIFYIGPWLYCDYYTWMEKLFSLINTLSLHISSAGVCRVPKNIA